MLFRSILEATDISVRFGGITALDGATLSAEAGTITGLIGPNGAGKTTMFDALTGFVEVDSGRICVDGREVTTMSPHRRSRLGVARTFQRLELFSGLTVLENVECAAGMSHGARGRARAAHRIAEPIIKRVGLGPVDGVGEQPAALGEHEPLGRQLDEPVGHEPGDLRAARGRKHSCELIAVDGQRIRTQPRNPRHLLGGIDHEIGRAHV